MSAIKYISNLRGKASHVLFDMDGLLLDTEDLYSAAYQAVMDSVGSGKTYTYDVKAGLMGSRPLECAKARSLI